MSNQRECPVVVGPEAEEAHLADKELFTPEERERLRRFRRAVRRGERSDSLPVDRRQEFIRWLIEQGKLSDK